MITLNFHGALRADTGQDSLEAFVATPLEALRLLECNCKGVLNKYFRRGQYILLLNGEPVTQKTMEQQLWDDDVIDFVPVVCGNGIFAIILAIIAVILAVVAIVLALTSVPKDDMDKESKSYQSDVNVSREGAIVPVVYGTDRTGSVVISSDRIVGTNQSAISGGGGLWGKGFLSSDWYDFTDAGIDFANTAIADGSTPSQSFLSSSTLTTQIVHAISEGPVVGLENGHEGVLFDDTKFYSGSVYNFSGVNVDLKDGSDPQTKLNMIQLSANPTSVAADLTTSYITRTLSSDLDFARVTFKVSSFFKTVDNKIAATSETLQVQKSPTGLGTWTTISQPVISGEYFDEKFFQLSFPLDNATQWDIRVRRTSAQVATDKSQDGIVWDSFTEIVNDRVTYDGTAVAGITYTNDSFGGANPKTEFILQGRIVKIPSNYNPVTRVYTGLWDGLFIDGFTDNPFYIALDTVENVKYGLGTYLIGFDKFVAYDLGVFSDVSVDDGKGGTEPRFTFNGTFRERKKVVKVLSDILSTARSQYIWDGGQLSFFMEQAKTPSYIAVNANIIDGDFSYQGASIDSKKNSVFVTYKDKANQYVKSVASYRDYASIRANGLNEVEFEGVGVTSAGQALRMAKYSVLTDGRINEFIGMEEFAKSLPGDLIEVYDANLTGSRNGGRVVSATTSAITIDAPYVIDGARTYEISVILPDGTYEKQTVTNGAGSTSVITVSPAFSLAPQVHAVWGITVDNLAPQQFIIQERKDVNGGYRISSLTYDPDKLTEIETGYSVETDIDAVLPTQHWVGSPQNVVFSEQVFQAPGVYRQDLVVSWDAPDASDSISGYDVYYSYEDGPQRTLELGGIDLSARIDGAIDGRYNFYIYARTPFATSDPALEFQTIDAISPAESVTVSGLELFGQGNDPIFINRDAKFVWRYNSSLQTEEIGTEVYGASSIFEDGIFKDFIISIYDTSTGDLVREEEGVRSTEYTYTLEKNVEDGGPRRNFRIEVQYRDIYNKVSDAVKLVVSNPAPELPSNIQVVGTIGGISVSYEPTVNLLDYAGVLVWASTSQGFTPDSTNLISDDNQTTMYFDFDAVPIYVRLAQYDTFGQDGLITSSEFVTTPKQGGFAIIDQITSGNIGTFIDLLAVSTAYIDDAAITNVKVGNAAIKEANIDNLAVSNAKIKDIIQSADYNDTTKAGWKLDKDGVIQGNKLQIYDNASNLVVSLGGDLGNAVGIGTITIRSLTNGLQSGFVNDGDVITFSRPFAQTPVVVFGAGGITAASGLTAPYGQSFVAGSLDGDGFTAILKLKELAASPVLETDDEGGSGGVVGATQDYEIKKDIATEAFDDNYTYQFDVSISNIAIGGGNFDPGWVDVSLYINNGSSWVQKATIRVWAEVATSPSESINNILKTIVADGLTNTSTTPRAFGISVTGSLIAGSITAFDKVTYTTATGSPRR